MRRYALPAIFLVFALGAFAAYRIGRPLTPEAALAKGFVQLGGAEFVTGLISASLSKSAEETPAALSGAFGLHFPASASPVANLTLATAEEGGKTGLRSEVIAVPGAMYFQMSGESADALGQLMPVEALGTWWKISENEQDSTTDAVFAADAWRRLRKLVAEGTMFAMDENVIREVMAGRPAYRLSLAVSKQGAEGFIRTWREAIYGRSLSAAEEASISGVLQNQALRVTIWLDVKNGSLLEILIEMQGENGSAQTVLLENLDMSTAFVPMSLPENAQPFVSTTKKLIPASK